MSMPSEPLPRPHKHDPYAALRVADYRFFLIGWFISLIGLRIQSTAIAWEMYQRTGRIFQKRHEMFVELSWFFIMHGMGLRPQTYDPLVDASDWQAVIKVMQGMRQKVAADVAAAPTHDSFFPHEVTESRSHEVTSDVPYVTFVTP